MMIRFLCMMPVLSYFVVTLMGSFCRVDAFCPSCLSTAPTATRLYDKKSTNKKSAARAKPKGFAGALRDLQLTTFKYAGAIRPGTQSPQKRVDVETIVKPDYSDDGVVRGLVSINPLFVWLFFSTTPFFIEIHMNKLAQI